MAARRESYVSEDDSASEPSSTDYNLFDSDSDSEPLPVDEEDEGPRPYRFEPRRQRRNEEADINDEARSESSSETDRVGNTDWCQWGSCQEMPPSAESVCCKKIDQVWEKVEPQQPDSEFPCITSHRGFHSPCLDVWVLETALYAYEQQHGGGSYTGHERFRYIAYRQLVRWCWGYLGKHVRVALPSCAVNKIREVFPAEFPTNYTGLKPPNL